MLPGSVLPAALQQLFLRRPVPSKRSVSRLTRRAPQAQTEHLHLIWAEPRKLAPAGNPARCQPTGIWRHL